MIQVVTFFTDCLFIKLWDLPFLSTFGGNKDEKPAKYS